VSADDPGQDSFEQIVRWIAREVSRSVERVAEVDVDEIAEAIGVDPIRARQWVDTAGQWLRAQAEGLGDDLGFAGAPAADEEAGAEAGADRPRRPGPHPLDVPTQEQGLALAALDSGRWTVEPGSNVLITHGEGPGPGVEMELVGELRARDWLSANGEVTLVGRDALSRWLDAAKPR
jgi:hypothetical protein